MKIKLIVFLFLLRFVIGNAYSQSDLQSEKEFFLRKGYIPLAGMQEGDYEANRYVVIKDMIIPQGKSVNFFPGSELFIKKNVSVIVKGKLIFSGKNDKRIRITTLPHDEYQYPFDSSVATYWEGITVDEGASAELTYADVENVKFAIKAAKNSTVVLDSVKFDNVKYTTLKYGNRIIKFPEKKNVFFNSELSGKFKVVKVKKKLPRKKRIRISLNVTGSLLTLGAAGVSAYCAKKTYDYKKKYDNATSPAAAEHYRKRTKTWYNYTLISSGSTLLLGGGTILTFTVLRKH